MDIDKVTKKLMENESIVQIETHPSNIFLIISYLQLALTHPCCVGEAAESAEIIKEMIGHLTEIVCKFVPEARELIERGWHKESLLPIKPKTEPEKITTVMEQIHQSIPSDVFLSLCMMIPLLSNEQVEKMESMIAETKSSREPKEPKQ